MVSSATVMNSESVVCRNPPGTKSEDFYKWPAQNFDEMDSTLAVQQHIQQMIRNDFTNIEGILSVPTGQDEGVWKYEHLRQFCLELNNLAVRLQEECTPETCSQMTATEQWIFLCAAHKTPKECPAIDYTRHTLDGAACLLNSNKYFPSRVSIKESSVAKLGSVCRRVYRIFSHAYFHHRQIFDEAENETYLCRRFTVFVTYYNLMSHDNLIVPILNNSEEGNISNNNSVIIASPNTSASEKHPKITIASFMNLPEGVIPDVEDADPTFEDLPLDVADEDNDGAEVDDGFTYANEDHYGTMKPMKGGSLSEAFALSEPADVDDETPQHLDTEQSVENSPEDKDEEADETVVVESDLSKIEEDVV